MLISKNLLASLQPQLAQYSNEVIKEALIKIGVEVEAVYQHQPINNIFFGYVHDTQKVPNSEKLSLCTVELSTGEQKQIVCGASNVRPGLKVVVVVPGAKLPNGLVVEKKTIFGVESDGMICSIGELNGIGPKVLTQINQPGIIELDDDFNYCQPFDPKVIGLDDVVFDLSITGNRADLHCAWGLAVELSQKLNLEFNLPDYQTMIDQLINRDGKANHQFEFIKDTTHNSFWTFWTIEWLKLKNSIWNKQKLLWNNNVNPVNNLVDLGNLVRLLFNQPIHFHDANWVNPKQISLSVEQTGNFLDLYGHTYQLIPGDIVVLDGHQSAIALGGIVGSYQTAISNKTKNVCLEMMNFNATLIVETKQRLKINTDAAISNSRHKSNYFSLLALNYLIQELPELGSLRIIGLGIKTESVVKIGLDWNWLNEFLGITLDQTLIIQQLTKLGFNFENNDFVIVPKWRLDLRTINDLAEEITNLTDINQLPTTAPTIQFNNQVNNQQFNLWKKIRNYWLNKNLFEAKTYNLQDNKLIKTFNFMNWKLTDKLKNPNHHGHDTLRLHGLKELLNVVKVNEAKQNESQNWFELINIQQTNGPVLTMNIITQPHQQTSFNQSYYQNDLYDLKALIEETCWLNETKVTFNPINNPSKELVNTFVPETCWGIYGNDKLIGFLGQINRPLLKVVSCNPKRPYLGAFLTFEPPSQPLIATPKELYDFPSSFQDFSLIKKWSTPELQTILDQISQIKYVVNTTVVEQKVINDQETSYLIRVQLNGQNKTLTDAEIQLAISETKEILLKAEVELR